MRRPTAQGGRASRVVVGGRHRPTVQPPRGASSRWCQAAIRATPPPAMAAARRPETSAVGIRRGTARTAVAVCQRAHTASSTNDGQEGWEEGEGWLVGPEGMSQIAGTHTSVAHRRRRRSYPRHLFAPVFGRSQVQAHSGGDGDLERTWSDDPAGANPA